MLAVLTKSSPVSVRGDLIDRHCGPARSGGNQFLERILELLVLEPFGKESGADLPNLLDAARCFADCGYADVVLFEVGQKYSGDGDPLCQKMRL